MAAIPTPAVAPYGYETFSGGIPAPAIQTESYEAFSGDIPTPYVGQMKVFRGTAEEIRITVGTVRPAYPIQQRPFPNSDLLP